MALKVMILTDSDGYPRSFPPSEVFALEESWPYLLRAHFKDAAFWQLSFGNITTGKLTSQPMGYLTHWQPDVIIVQSGIADCRPEAFSEFQTEVIKHFSWKFFRWLKTYMNHPAWIRRRQMYRVSPGAFRTAIRKFKLVFSGSKILWLEISTGPKYEQFRPGVERRKEEFNAIIKDVYGKDFIPVQEKLRSVDGFNAGDHGHQNKRGHRVLADVLIERIGSSIASRS